MSDAVVFDSSFLISIMRNDDIFHQSAVDYFNKIHREDNKYFISDIVLKETIFTLLNFDSLKNVQDRILTLSKMNKTVIFNIDVLTYLKYLDKYYSQISQRSVNQSSITKTNDFLITSIALDLKADIITSDQQILKTCRRNSLKCHDYSMGK